MSGLSVCPWCRLPLTGAEADNLRRHAARIAELHGELARMSHEYETLRSILIERRLAADALAWAPSDVHAGVPPAVDHGVPGPAYPPAGHRAPQQSPATPGEVFAPAPVPLPAHAPARDPLSRRQWRPETVRDVLLWIGGTLLALAVLAFAGYAWSRFGPVGRGSLLGALMLGTAALALFLRRKVPMTAEVMAVLTVVEALVVWALMRHTGLGAHVNLSAWWAVGTTWIALVALVLGAGGLAAGRISGSALAIAAMPQVLGITHVTGIARTAGAIGWSAVACACALAGWVLHRTPTWKDAAVVSVVGLAAATVVSFAVTLWAGVAEAHGGGAGPIALAVVCAGVAPFITRLAWGDRLALATGWVNPASPLDRRTGPADLRHDQVDPADLLVALSTLCCLGGVAALVATSLPLQWLAVVAVGTGALPLATARWLGERWWLGVFIGGAIVCAAGAVQVLVPAFRAAAMPLSWWTKGWTGSVAWQAIQHLTPSGATMGAALPSATTTIFAIVILGSVVCALPSKHARFVLAPQAAVALVTTAAAGIVVLGPIEARMRIATTVLTLTAGAVAGVAGAAVLAHRHSRWTASCVAVGVGSVVLVSLGWAAVAASTTVPGIGVAICLCGAGACIAEGTGPYRPAFTSVIVLLAGAETGLIAVATGGTPDAAGLAVVGLGVVVMLVGRTGVERIGGRMLAISTEATGAFVAGAGLIVLAVWYVKTSRPEVPPAAHVGAALWLAIGLLAIAVATAAAVRRVDRPGYPWVASAALLAAAGLWPVALGGSAWTSGFVLVIASAALLAAGALGTWRIAGPNAGLANETSGAVGCVAGLIALVVHFVHASRPEVPPAAHVGAALWLAIGLLAIAAATAAAVRRVDRPGYPWVASAALLAAAGLWPVALGGSAWTSGFVLAIASAALLAAGALGTWRIAGPNAGLANETASGLAAVTGFALQAGGHNLAALALAASVLAIAFVCSSTRQARPAYAWLAPPAVLGAAALWAPVAGASGAVAAFVVLVCAVGIVVAGALGVWRLGGPAGRWANETVGMSAMVFATSSEIASGHPVWLAICVSAFVPAFVLASLGRNRPAYRWAAAGGAVLATWSWLYAERIGLPEAYAWPAAAVAIVAGVFTWRARVAQLELDFTEAADIARVPRPAGEESHATRRGWAAPLNSWAVFAPGVLTALLPTSVLAIEGDGIARQIVGSLLALAAMLAGARFRLQAPLTLGALDLVALGSSLAYPHLMHAPRWILLGLIGVVLLWLGATAERRLDQVRRARSFYLQLG